MDYLTISEISRQSGIPESTVRYYRDRFHGFLPSIGEGRNRRYRRESVAVVNLISELFRNGVTAEDVEKALIIRFGVTIESQRSAAAAQQQSAAAQQQSAAASDVIIRKDELPAVLFSISSLVQKFEDDLDLMKEEVIKARGEFKEYRDEVKSHNDRIEKLMDLRNDILNGYFEELRKGRKKSFWARIFQK